MADYQQGLPPLATLVAFEAAHRHRNFTRAAAELHTSQATVSRRVRELEVDLAVCLFERNRYDVTPTPGADDFAASVRLALGALVSGADELRRQAVGPGALTVLTSLSLASSVVAPVIGEMQRRHPKLNLRVLSACEPIEATTEVFDLAIQYGPAEVARYEVEAIAAEQVYPVCAPDLAARLSARPTVEALADQALLDVAYDDPSWIDWSRYLAVTGAGTAAALGRVAFSSYQLCLDVAERGEGVALGWDRSVANRIQAGTLVRVPGMAAVDAGAINAYLPRSVDSRARPGEVLELLALLRGAVAANEPGETAPFVPSPIRES
ncbi:MAG: LysR substrate-binding domain-containing protein [Actinomycetota bacterium]